MFFRDFQLIPQTKFFKEIKELKLLKFLHYCTCVFLTCVGIESAMLVTYKHSINLYEHHSYFHILFFISVWDINSKTCYRTFKHRSRVLSVALSKTQCITGCEQGRVKVWNLHSGKLIKVLQDII